PKWELWRTLTPPSGESQLQEGAGVGRRAWICGALGVKPQKWQCCPVKLHCHGLSVIGVFIYCLRILHIYAAKGLRAHTLAAAERMRALRRLDAKEHRGKTPLLVAVTARQAAIVHDLIQAGADINAVDNKGQSALHLAATYALPPLCPISIFLALSSPPSHISFPGHTPLHCAVLAHNTLLRDQGRQAVTEEQHRELQQQSRELESCIHLLVQTGASIYSRDVKSNKTVLHYTVQDGNISLLRYFLELNAFKSKDFVNNKAHGNTALHMAAALPGDKNQKEIIQLLLEHGADPSIRNLDNDQPIHMAPPGKGVLQHSPAPPALAQGGVRVFLNLWPQAAMPDSKR
uniref:IKBD inhibitor n=1 Tax=Zosterops lateralis melanops TaxID=1220523 RepID=A0A8D2PUS6_ZOSLA